ncbi:hypothetical protein [Actinacidiphila sp. ITFR-21]|uniref:hypothetical protein n=1 Tax=Actinacidiphila sp. ITFR-21 TaxID=3075199 RepID=UPI00288A9685|nr:hypothetical protein [Streptomyces sp. ITFR-21]WNI19918.1 hypothetical protein RLT57_30710 [Streptomyces sp. ITFR-21]
MGASQHARLTDFDKADGNVAAYLAAMDEVRRLEGDLADARAKADRHAAAMDTQTGEARGRLGRLAGHLGVKEQSLKNQRQRGSKRRAEETP